METTKQTVHLINLSELNMELIDRDDYIYFAKLAEQTKRWSDMISFMKSASRVEVKCFYN